MRPLLAFFTQIEHLTVSLELFKNYSGEPCYCQEGEWCSRRTQTILCMKKKRSLPALIFSSFLTIRPGSMHCGLFQLRDQDIFVTIRSTVYWAFEDLGRFLHPEGIMINQDTTKTKCHFVPEKKIRQLDSDNHTRGLYPPHCVLRLLSNIDLYRNSSLAWIFGSDLKIVLMKILSFVSLYYHPTSTKIAREFRQARKVQVVSSDSSRKTQDLMMQARSTQVLLLL